MKNKNSNTIINQLVVGWFSHIQTLRHMMSFPENGPTLCTRGRFRFAAPTSVSCNARLPLISQLYHVIP